MKKEPTFRRKILFPIITFSLTLLILVGFRGNRFPVLVAVRSAGYPTAATMPHPVMG
ncbi:MAG: hypothetical protein R2788_01535 [Saprospiraceae bacterium]